MVSGGTSLTAATYRPILDQVTASGPDVKYGNSGTDLS
jgi:hypothetical protein